MNQQRGYPGSDAWRDAEPGGYRGGSFEGGGYQGGGGRESTEERLQRGPARGGRHDDRRGYESGGYAGAGYARDVQPVHRDADEGHRGQGWDAESHLGERRDVERSSTYGGLGEGSYGSHGWGRRGDAHDLDDRQFDPDYRQWREQQMRELDRDYELWRQERYKKFSEEFNQWRESRRRPSGQSAGSDTPGGSTGAASPKTG
jgi:hypothetical protein